MEIQHNILLQDIIPVTLQDAIPVAQDIPLLQDSDIPVLTQIPGNQSDLGIEIKVLKTGRGNKKIKVPKVPRASKAEKNLLNPAEKKEPTKRIGWRIHYAALLEYCKEHGTCNVPYHNRHMCLLSNFNADGTDLMYNGNLGHWLSDQRRRKRGTCSGGLKLSPEQNDLMQQLVDNGLLLWNALEDLGRTSSKMSKAKGDMEWPRNYAALLRYIAEFGHGNVPGKGVYECILPGLGDNGGDLQFKANLGSWLSDQRRRKKGTLNKLRLSPEREALLQELADRDVFKWVVRKL